MSRLKAVEMLIKRHRQYAQDYADLANWHLQKAKEYEEYSYELRKPGFRVKGSRRFTGNKNTRIEPYLIQSEDATVQSRD